MPPPRTRASSGTPLLRDRESSTDTCEIGIAGVLTGPATVRPWGTAPSATLPHAWHSPHRPTHLAVSHPHSEQRYVARGLACRGGPTVGQRPDKPGRARLTPGREGGPPPPVTIRGTI